MSRSGVRNGADAGEAIDCGGLTLVGDERMGLGDGADLSEMAERHGLPPRTDPGTPAGRRRRWSISGSTVLGVVVAGVAILLAGIAIVVITTRTFADHSSVGAAANRAVVTNATDSPAASPAEAPEEYLKAVRRFVYDQTEVPGELTAKCTGWVPKETRQDLNCKVTYEGQVIDLELAVDRSFSLTDKHVQTKTFLSGEAVRKAFARKFSDLPGARNLSCDSSLPVNAVVDYDMPLPYTCSYQEASGSVRRYKVSIQSIGITFS